MQRQQALQLQPASRGRAIALQLQQVCAAGSGGTAPPTPAAAGRGGAAPPSTTGGRGSGCFWRAAASQPGPSLWAGGGRGEEAVRFHAVHDCSFGTKQHTSLADSRVGISAREQQQQHRRAGCKPGIAHVLARQRPQDPPWPPLASSSEKSIWRARAEDLQCAEQVGQQGSGEHSAACPSGWLTCRSGWPRLCQHRLRTPATDPHDQRTHCRQRLRS